VLVMVANEKRHLGHNPAGAVIIIALIAMLAAICVSGYMMTTDAHWGAKWMAETHNLLANCNCRPDRAPRSASSLLASSIA